MQVFAATGLVKEDSWRTDIENATTKQYGKLNLVSFVLGICEGTEEEGRKLLSFASFVQVEVP